MEGSPIYLIGNKVRFIFNNGITNEEKAGTIRIVNPLCSLFDESNELSYDIDVINDKEICFYKHIPETNIFGLESDDKT